MVELQRGVLEQVLIGGRPGQMSQERLVKVLGEDLIEVVVGVGVGDDLGCPQPLDKVPQRTARGTRASVIDRLPYVDSRPRSASRTSGRTSRPKISHLVQLRPARDDELGDANPLVFQEVPRPTRAETPGA